MFGIKITSPKTTWFGIIAIISAVSNVALLLMDGDPATNPDWTATMSAISAGIAAIFARDNNVTSEKAGAVQ